MGFMYMNWDIWYFVLVIPAFVFSLIASSAVKKTFQKYSNMPSARKITGAQAARKILDHNDLSHVSVEQVPGELTDHFDPRSNVLRLSQSTFNSFSVAAIGVAAHEAGHAIQHARSYMPNKIRGVLVPVANIGSRIGPYLAIFGLIMRMTILTNIGIVLFAVAVLFYLITLPVEFNASRRAISILDNTGILYGDEITAARRVLTAAAMTYVASLVVALASFARLILLSRGRRR
ncbi:MAG: zinc metallopeptidase [Eubacteriales bacterium]|nr:zinc metallopeptidase [Eubacteriales bacterium]